MHPPPSPPGPRFSWRSPEPIAAASLGQVYKGRLRSTGEQVAVKVQRPGVLETVTVDLYIIRQLGLFLRRFPAITRVGMGVKGSGMGVYGWLGRLPARAAAALLSLLRAIATALASAAERLPPPPTLAPS